MGDKNARNLRYSSLSSKGGGGEDQAIIHYAASRCQQKWAWMSGGHKQKHEKHTLLLRKHSVVD